MKKIKNNITRREAAKWLALGSSSLMVPSLSKFYEKKQ